MKFRKLRGRIREYYETQELFANDLGISATTLSKKLNGKTEWTRQEIERACLRLEIPGEDVSAYFFAF